MAIQNRNSGGARQASRQRAGIFARQNDARRNTAPRRAGKKKNAQDERQPGQLSSALRRRMGDALADLFDEFGPEIYSETILSLKDVILEKFQAGFEALDSTVQSELGRRGIEESRQHIRGWSNEIVEDVNHFGLDEVAGALEDYVGSLAAEFQQPEAEEGDELLELDDDEPVEEVAEEDVEAVEPEEADLALEGEEDELDLADLGLELPEEAAARFGPLGGRRRRPAPRRFRREASGRPFGASRQHVGSGSGKIPTSEASAKINQYLLLHGRMSARDIADDLFDGDDEVVRRAARRQEDLTYDADWGVEKPPPGGHGTWYGTWEIPHRPWVKPRPGKQFVGSPRDPVVLEFEDEDLYEEDEMSPDDAYMQVSGRLGSRVDVSIEGKYIDTFGSQEEAEAFVAQWAAENNFFPNLWFIDDHGGTHGPLPY